MKLFRYLVFLLFCGFSPCALAQSTATPSQIGYLTTSGCPSGQTVCFVQYGAIISISGNQTALTAVAGTQRGLSIASATALTIPSGATTAIIQAQGTNNSTGVCLYWQDDGTNPTNSAGQQLSAGGSITYKVTALPIILIAASGATCTATISYYK